MSKVPSTTLVFFKDYKQLLDLLAEEEKKENSTASGGKRTTKDRTKASELERFSKRMSFFLVRAFEQISEQYAWFFLHFGFVAMPSDAKWVQMAKKVAAGTALDDEVCSFKLTFAVLEKLPVDFVATAYEHAAKSYRTIANTVKTETRQRMKNI